MKTPQNQVFSRARPIRIAYLVDIDSNLHPVLDAIFKYSFSIWGGRFSLIIPCSNGQPLPAYLDWLERYDPDFVYSYVSISPSIELSLHELIYPSSLKVHHWGHPSQPPYYAPNLDITPLSISTLIPLAGTPSALSGSKGVRLIDAMGTLEGDRFLLDSFGLAHNELRNLMSMRLKEWGTTIVAVTDNDLLPRQNYLSENEITVPSISELLKEMSANRNILGVSHLSSMFTLRLNIHSPRWSDTFNIVVGNNAADRILYWNVRSLMPSWRDGQDMDLCIPGEMFDDPDFVETLRTYLTRRNHSNNGRGPSTVTIRSTSISSMDLERLASMLQEANTRNIYKFEPRCDVSDCIPSQQELEHAHISWAENFFSSASVWTESVSNGDHIRLTPSYPQHMRYVPATLLSPTNGTWAIDIDIERSVDHSPYINVNHRWQLPRRLRIAEAFCHPYKIPRQNNPNIFPRVSIGGYLTLYGAPETSLPEITIPSDHDAIKFGLERGRNWIQTGVGKVGPIEQVCYQANRSGTGKYFWGIFQLFGSINSARSFFLHEFWRTQLEHYAATDQATGHRHEHVKGIIRKRFRKNVFNLNEDADINSLTKIILKEADENRTSFPSLSWTRFEKDFNELTARYNSANPYLGGGDYDLEEEARQNLDQLRESVQALCHIGVLHQGYEHKCINCLHRSWIGISYLKANIVCEVCGADQPAPVDRSWDFRLNGFLREALRSQGVGPLFWVLSRIQRDSSRSFWFEGPLDIYFDNKINAHKCRKDTDIDLTIIEGGVVRMCEVKQSERHFNPIQLAETMKKLRPDIAVIAVMEVTSPALEKKYNEFQLQLSSSGIKPELITLDESRDISSAPYF